MIKMEELRIGNKVKVTIGNDAGIYQVIGIPGWGMDGRGDGKEPLIMIDRCPRQLVPESKLRPIHVTEEMIRRMGFYDEDNGWFKHEGFRKTMRWINVRFLSDELLKHPFLRIDGLCDIFFIHQLQNFFFSVTATELNEK